MHISKKHVDGTPKLKREIGLFEMTMYGVGIILGAGIYALIGEAASVAGNALWMSFLVGAFIACLTGLTYAELSSIFPKVAAEYHYTKKAFGKPLVSFIIEWMMIVVGVVSAAAVALGFGGYLSGLIGSNIIIGAVILIILCAFLIFWGIKQTVKVNVIFTLIEILGLLVIIFLGIGHFGSVDYFETPSGFSGIMIAAILVFFAYIGFEGIVNVAEETKNPRKTLPKAIVLSIAISTILYILVAISAISILPWQTLGASSAPLADVANAAMPGSYLFLSIIALFATANTVLIIMLANSRIIWGMSREKVFPTVFNKIHPQRHTPHIAILLTLIATIMFALIGNIRIVAEITNFGIFFIFIFINAALIVLRYKYPNIKRPFKVPINIGKFPVLPFIGLLFCVYMITYFDIIVIKIGAVIIIAGAIAHYIFKKTKLIEIEKIS